MRICRRSGPVQPSFISYGRWQVCTVETKCPETLKTTTRIDERSRSSPFVTPPAPVHSTHASIALGGSTGRLLKSLIQQRILLALSAFIKVGLIKSGSARKNFLSVSDSRMN